MPIRKTPELIKFNPTTRIVKLPDGDIVKLSPRERSLFAWLHQYQRQPDQPRINAETLVEKIWNGYASKGTAQKYIHLLKMKIPNLEITSSTKGTREGGTKKTGYRLETEVEINFDDQ